MYRKLCSIRFGMTPRHAAWLAVALTLAPSGVAHATLTHKYTFNDGTANDSASTAHGTLENGAAVGGAGAVNLNGTNHYVSLPAPTLALNTYTNATFEGWFTYTNTNVWARLFDFGDTNPESTFGRNYIFYTPASGGGDNRAAISDQDPGFNGEDQARGTGVLSTGVQHHVAVVVDQSVTNTMSLYVDGVLAPPPGGGNNPVTLLRPLSVLSPNLAYLGRSLYNDPYMAGSIDEFRIYDNALSAAEVAANFAAGPDPPNVLALTVNTVGGNIKIENISGSPQSFDYYQITSTAGQLKPANGSWNSLDDQNIDSLGGDIGQSWDESGGANANQLAELFLQGSSTLAAGANFNLGNAFNTALGAGDLKFQFSLTSGEIVSGKVNYVSVVTNADFNSDGRVDGTDFLRWQQNLGIASGATLAQGDADGNGAVNAADLAVWRSSFGSAVAVVDAVPEPASACLAALALIAAVGGTRRRNN